MKLRVIKEVGEKRWARCKEFGADQETGKQGNRNLEMVSRNMELGVDSLS